MATIRPTGNEQPKTEPDLTSSQPAETDKSGDAPISPFFRAHAVAQTFLRAYVVYIVLGLLGSTLAILGFLWFSQRNYPPFSSLEVKGTISLAGRPENVLITCSCPEAFTVSKPRTVTFRIELQSDPKQPEATKAQLESKEVLSVFLYPEGDAEIRNGSASAFIGDTLGDIFRDKTTEGTLMATVTAKDTSLTRFRFGFFTGNRASQDKNAGNIYWAVGTHMDAFTTASPFLIGFLVFVCVVMVGLVTERALRQAGKRAREVEQVTLEKAAANPGKLRFDWQLASNRLNQYFEGNLLQVRLVFWIAVLVMFVGFSFVLGGIFLAIRNATPTSAWLSGAAGVITQFIGATFLVIYRSTMSQAGNFMTILQQMNTTGTALLVLDSMPDGDPKKLDTQATVVAALLRVPPATPAADVAKTGNVKGGEMASIS